MNQYFILCNNNTVKSVVKGKLTQSRIVKIFTKFVLNRLLMVDLTNRGDISDKWLKGLKSERFWVTAMLP